MASGSDTASDVLPVAGQGLRRLNLEAAGQHGEGPQGPLLGGREQGPGAVEHRAERAVALGQILAGAAEEPGAPGQLALDLGAGEHVRP